MNREEAHKLIDLLFDAGKPIGGTGDVTFTTPPPAEPVRALPEGKRVVRTKTSGDKVYLLDEVKKTRQWIASGEVLTSLGFEQADVEEIADTDLFKYSMGATLYRVE